MPEVSRVDTGRAGNALGLMSMRLLVRALSNDELERIAFPYRTNDGVVHGPVSFSPNEVRVGKAYIVPYCEGDDRDGGPMPIYVTVEDTDVVVTCLACLAWPP